MPSRAGTLCPFNSSWLNIIGSVSIPTVGNTFAPVGNTFAVVGNTFALFTLFKTILWQFLVGSTNTAEIVFPLPFEQFDHQQH